MGLTVVLSGPKSARAQVLTALAAAGYPTLNTEHDHGLPPSPIEGGDDPGQPIGFVTVETPGERGEGVDAVAAVAKTCGYVLRMHHETPPEPPPNRLDVIMARLDQIEGRVEELSNGR